MAHSSPVRTGAFLALIPLAVAAVLVGTQQVSYGQRGGGCAFGRQSVGGVHVDTDGVLRNVERDEARKLQQAMEQALRQAPGELTQYAELRKVSLRRLEAAIGEAQMAGKDLSQEMRFLAGLQRIQYVFLYPDERDIVLAGPAEGWRFNEQGEVVGLTTGRSVMLLDDLLVALRSIESGRRSGISCSIDPNPAGLKKLQELVSTLRTIGSNPAATIASIEQALGPQTITVTGVADTSHFARVMVTADYKMKRLAMRFDPAPVPKLPSFMELAQAGPRGLSNMLPRWWLAPRYDALLADPDGMAWELRGAGVKAVAEEDFLAAGGNVQRGGQADALAQKWADGMTAQYDQLAKKEIVFGQLSNCMDLAIVAALISKEQLAEKCGHRFTLLLSDRDLAAEEYNPPQRVDSKASVMRKGQNWLISASGGVQMNPWSVLEKTERSPSLTPARAKAKGGSPMWWWN